MTTMMPKKNTAVAIEFITWALAKYENPFVRNFNQFEQLFDTFAIETYGKTVTAKRKETLLNEVQEYHREMFMMIASNNKAGIVAVAKHAPEEYELQHIC